jgi:hypothetical protein
VIGHPRHHHAWRGDARSAHVALSNANAGPADVYIRGTTTRAEAARPWRLIRLEPGEAYRLAVAQSHPAETGVEVLAPRPVAVDILDCLDRAHFPTRQEQEATAAFA